MTLKQLAKIYKFFDPKPTQNGMYRVFDTWECEICKKPLMQSNGCSVDIPPSYLRRAGIRSMTTPGDEGGWSELHECATCSECCYNPDAKKQVALEKDDLKSADILDRATNCIQAEWDIEKKKRS